MSSIEFGEGEGEFRVIGPPGCGKTEAASEIAKKSSQTYGFDKVLLTSFSRSAAATIAQRADVPEENVGTLHHFGRRLLDKGWKLYDSKGSDFLRKFNAANPLLAVASNQRSIDNDDGGGGGFDDDDMSGEALLAKRDRLMGNLVGRELWPADVAHFHDLWEAAKQDAGVIDFQDMMNAAYEAESAPGDPSVIIVDEAQDFSRQQVEIVRRWGKNAQQIYLIGDDDQVLYRWRGASSEAMMHPVLEDWRYRYLSQSYRVPRAVHAAAMPWIERINPENRLHKDYKPRDFDGSVHAVGHSNCKEPRALIGQALDHIDEGRDVMFIASCRRMLLPLTHILQRNGIPYGNKYVPKNFGWNPLRNDTELMKGVLSFLVGIDHPKGLPGPRQWTVKELLGWADCLKGMARDWKGKHELLVDELGERIPDKVDATERTLEMVVGKKLDELFDALERAAKGDGSPLHFFSENIKAALAPKKKYITDTSKVEFIENIVERWTAKALYEPPKITLGTIHSVKGGEADVVYLFPDLSKPQKEDWDGWNGVGEIGRESLIRLFYVAMTRAKEHLVIAAPEQSAWGAADMWRYV